MNKDTLESKISQILEVSDPEKKLAFSLFKEKLSQTLSVGEAIKINDLGVFQLKEQLDHSEKKDSKQKSSSLALIFSPHEEEPSADTLFLTLELDYLKNDETEFNENVFQVGLGKPLITDLDQNIKGKENILSNSEIIENKISGLIDNSEKLTNFDLWEDYLKRKETTDILKDEPETEQPEDSIIDTDEESNDLENNLLDEDIASLEEDDIIGEIDKEDLANEDEVLLDESEVEIIDEFRNTDLDYSEVENDFKEVISEELEEDFDNLDNETNLEKSFDESEIDTELNIRKEESEMDLDIEKEQLESKEIEESVIEKINKEISDNEIIENENSGEETIDETIYQDKIEDLDSIQKENIVEEEQILETEKVNEEISTSENENSDEQLVEHGNDDEDKVELETANQESKRSKTLLWVLIAAFLIVGAIAIYYLFFDFNKSNNIQLTENVEINNEEDSGIEDDNPDQLVENSSEIISNQPDETDDPTNIVSVDETDNSNDESNNIAETETEVYENIYFDGFVYNVQVSSWKQERIALGEVNKLVKKGLPAYKIRVFIPKFDDYWHRVRIGPFTSLEEAKEIQNKVNK